MKNLPAADLLAIQHAALLLETYAPNLLTAELRQYLTAEKK